MLWMPWEQIHINFVTELPKDNGYETIMTYIDHISKMVVLVKLQEYDAQKVISHFLVEIESLQTFSDYH